MVPPSWSFTISLDCPHLSCRPSTGPPPRRGLVCDDTPHCRQHGLVRGGDTPFGCPVALHVMATIVALDLPTSRCSCLQNVGNVRPNAPLKCGIAGERSRAHAAWMPPKRSAPSDEAAAAQARAPPRRSSIATQPCGRPRRALISVAVPRPHPLPLPAVCPWRHTRASVHTG